MNRYADILLALLLAVFTVQAQAGIVIGGTRVIYNGDKKTSASIRNPDRSGVWLVQSWVDSGMKGNKTPFIVTPPLFRINPGKRTSCALCALEGACLKIGNRCSG
jgi:P pilus assembly chaperone PapD